MPIDKYNYTKILMEVLMFGSNVLEIAIGLIFVYSLLSLLCSTINEQVIVKLLALRAKTLEDGIKTMLKNTLPNDPTGQELTKEFYKNPLIQSLTTGVTKPPPTPSPTFALALKDALARILRLATGFSKPSYISSRSFALALKDVLADSHIDLSTIPALKPVQDQIKSGAQQETASIENWYDETMDRVSGWYKRKVQLIILLLGFVITIILNVDTISIITSLSNSSALRATIVSAAQGSANIQTSTNQITSQSLTTLQKQIEQTQPVIGWSSSTLPTNVWGWLLKIAGLLATTFAISLGADFWFGLLKDFIRSSGPPPAKDSGTTGSTGTASQPVAGASTSSDTTVQ
jgi:hypothetical protein